MAKNPNQKRASRVRFKLKQVSGGKPRLSVFRSNKNMHAQLIDDTSGVTLASASTVEKEFKGKVGSNIEAAKAIGTLIAQRAKEKKVSEVAFDRGSFIYHGRVKALADAAREAGLKF